MIKFLTSRPDHRKISLDILLNLFILDIDRQVLWQTVKTEIKFCNRPHFNRFYTVC